MTASFQSYLYFCFFIFLCFLHLKHPFGQKAEMWLLFAFGTTGYWNITKHLFFFLFVFLVVFFPLKQSVVEWQQNKCLFGRQTKKLSIFTYIKMNIYIFIYMYVYTVSVCIGSVLGSVNRLNLAAKGLNSPAKRPAKV